MPRNIAQRRHREFKITTTLTAKKRADENQHARQSTSLHGALAVCYYRSLWQRRTLSTRPPDLTVLCATATASCAVLSVLCSLGSRLLKESFQSVESSQGRRLTQHETTQASMLKLDPFLNA